MPDNGLPDPQRAKYLRKLRPSGALADAIEDFLLTGYPSRKRPFVAAQVLALILELHAKDKPWPLRHDIAEALGCSVFGIDAALSVAMGRGLLTIETRVIQGNVEQRDSAIKQRHYIPSDELLALYRQPA